MKQKEIIYLLEELQQEKGIDINTLVQALEAALLSAVRKRVSPDVELEVKFNISTGETQVFQIKEVVDEVKDPNREISLDEAKTYKADIKVGEKLHLPYTVADLGRIAAQTAKQVMIQKLKDAERDVVYKTYKAKEEDIVPGRILREEKGSYIVDLGRGEGILPPKEQVKNERYKKGDTLKFYIVEVKKTGKGPRVVLSRTHPKLLIRLFEREMPEIMSGLVEIKAVAREPGERSKVAVASSDPEINGVGACVGIRGARVQSIVRELQGENIDIVEYSDDPEKFIANALKPAIIRQIEIDEEKQEAKVIVDDDQFSLAIGRRGQNVRLAAKLTGWKIDIRPLSEVRAESGETED